MALTVGWFAVAESSRAQYATLDSSINAVVSSGLRNPNTALSNALYVVQHDNYNLDLVVVFPPNQITPVKTGTVPLSGRPNYLRREGLAESRGTRGQSARLSGSLAQRGRWRLLDGRRLHGRHREAERTLGAPGGCSPLSWWRCSVWLSRVK